MNANFPPHGKLHLTGMSRDDELLTQLRGVTVRSRRYRKDCCHRKDLLSP